jgi:hypothetical protein
MGNHDNQAALRGFLLDEAPSTAPLARVRMIDGLGIITVDTSVPGFPHGNISTSQLDWLAEQLATPDRGCHWPDSSSKSNRHSRRRPGAIAVHHLVICRVIPGRADSAPLPRCSPRAARADPRWQRRHRGDPFPDSAREPLILNTRLSDEVYAPQGVTGESIRVVGG